MPHPCTDQWLSTDEHEENPWRATRTRSSARSSGAGTPWPAASTSLTARVNPKKLADDGRQAAAAKLADPKIKYALIGVGVLVVAALVRSIFR